MEEDPIPNDSGEYYDGDVHHDENVDGYHTVEVGDGEGSDNESSFTNAMNNYVDNEADYSDNDEHDDEAARPIQRHHNFDFEDEDEDYDEDVDNSFDNSQALINNNSNNEGGHSFSPNPPSSLTSKFNGVNAGVSWTNMNPDDDVSLPSPTSLPDSDFFSSTLDRGDNEDDEEDDYSEEDDDDIEKYLQQDHSTIPLSDLDAARKERRALRKVHNNRQTDIILLWNMFNNGQTDKDRKQQLLQLAEAKSCTLHNYGYLQHLYSNTLDKLAVLWDATNTAQSNGDKRITALTKVLDKRDAKLNRLLQAYKVYIREIAKESRHSNNNIGTHISNKLLLSLEDKDTEIDEELHQVRLKYLHAKYQVEMLEKAKDKAGDDMNNYNIIDVEQNRVELNTLNEQLEEKLSSLHKLHKKLSTIGQICNHVREKLAFVRTNNEKLQQQLHEHTNKNSGVRKELSVMKHTKDNLKKNNYILKQKQGFINYDGLVDDYEQKKAGLSTLTQQLQQLKNEHLKLTSFVEQANREIEAHNRLRGGSGGNGTGSTMGGSNRYGNMANHNTISSKGYSNYGMGAYRNGK